MKKLLIVPAVALGLLFSTNVNAQETKTVETEKETAMLTVEANDQQQQRDQKDFQKIEVNQVPSAVTAALNRDHQGATIAEAHKKDNKYKLIVNVNNERKTLYADANGNWIKKDKK